jgi:hypothetical protein
MSKSLSQQARASARGRTLLGAAFVLACAFGTVTHAAAQNPNFPEVPDTIKPREGNTPFFIAHAFGSQGYTCLPTSDGGTAWSTNARPEATLFIKVFGHLVQVITHFASIDANPNEFAPDTVPLSGNATWQSSFDTSKVWAKKVAGIPAGSDNSCPHTGSIDCLLLQSIGNQEGPTGGKFLAKTTFVQRLNTRGGAVPTTACTVGQTELRGYEADYVFFHGHE